MALACTATPATPANTPNIDATVEARLVPKARTMARTIEAETRLMSLMSEDEAVALVEQHLQKISPGGGRCLYFKEENIESYSLGAPLAQQLKYGNWHVWWSETWAPAMWNVHPTTKEVTLVSSLQISIEPCP